MSSHNHFCSRELIEQVIPRRKVLYHFSLIAIVTEIKISKVRRISTYCPRPPHARTACRLPSYGSRGRRRGKESEAALSTGQRAGARLPHTRSRARTYVSLGNAEEIGKRAEDGGARLIVHPPRSTLGRERKHDTTLCYGEILCSLLCAMRAVYGIPRYLVAHCFNF